MSQGQIRRGGPALALVSPVAPQPSAPAVAFCSHCGERPAPVRGPEPRSRVCESCGFGLLLQCAANVAPAPGQPFLVLDQSMSVCAVSAGAEELLATRETEAVNHHVTELIVPADAEADARHNLAMAVTWAVRGEEAAHKVVVRPANTFGIRLTARIAACGPPQAALLVFDGRRR
jgi:hypothetical protein